MRFLRGEEGGRVSGALKGYSPNFILDKGVWICEPTSCVHLVSASTESNHLLTIYDDELMTADNDGIQKGDMIYLREYNSFENTESKLLATFNFTFPNNDLSFIFWYPERLVLSDLC